MFFIWCYKLFIMKKHFAKIYLILIILITLFAYLFVGYNMTILKDIGYSLITMFAVINILIAIINVIIEIYLNKD